ncbi:MAG TPA: tripartite tricarboxylate transporter substrate-binding protein, partial [Ramlibacter sp.]
KDTIGIPAPASIPEFLVGMIATKYKVDVQAAPYRGGAPMMADMLGNQIRSGVAGVPDFMENHKAGKMRIVAVIGDKRQAVLPDVPTFAELGVAGLEDLPYYGFFAPAGTPAPVLERFNQGVAKVLAMPDVREKLVAMGLTVGYQPQAQFAGRVRTYTQTWERIIKASGFVAK